MVGLNDLKGVFFLPKRFYDSISTLHFGFVKKKEQHYKGEAHPLLPAHTTPLQCCFLKQGRNQHHTNTKLFLQTPTFLCSALPFQLIFSEKKQLQGCRIKDSQRQCTLTNHSAWQTWAGLSSPLSAEGLLAESETLLLQLSCACPSSCPWARAQGSNSHSLAQVIHADNGNTRCLVVQIPAPHPVSRKGTKTCWRQRFAVLFLTGYLGQQAKFQVLSVLEASDSITHSPPLALHMWKASTPKNKSRARLLTAKNKFHAVPSRAASVLAAEKSALHWGSRLLLWKHMKEHSAESLHFSFFSLFFPEFVFFHHMQTILNLEFLSCAQQ